MNSKTVASNKKARFDFFLEERFIAGLALEGWEVKSLRQGKLNIKEAYIKDIKDELWLVGSRIDPLAYINQKESVNPMRFRKLLLKKREVSNILFANEPVKADISFPTKFSSKSANEACASTLSLFF